MTPHCCIKLLKQDKSFLFITPFLYFLEKICFKNTYITIPKAIRYPKAPSAGIPQIFGDIFVVQMILELIKSAITHNPITTLRTSLLRSLSNSNIDDFFVSPCKFSQVCRFCEEIHLLYRYVPQFVQHIFGFFSCNCYSANSCQ